MVIIDTTVWVDYLNEVATPQTDWLDRELDRQRLGLTDLILGDFSSLLARNRLKFSSSGDLKTVTQYARIAKSQDGQIILFREYSLCANHFRGYDLVRCTENRLNRARFLLVAGIYKCIKSVRSPNLSASTVDRWSQEIG